MNVENLIEKEESEKQEKINAEFNDKLNNIISQKDLINKALNQKKTQSEIFNQKLLMQKKIKQITEHIKIEMLKNREDLKSRIKIKQLEEERKRQIIQSKIDIYKNEITKKLLNAGKNGNYEECDPERSSDEIINYCSINYDKDQTKKSDCIQKNNFCFMCCESEYGDLHLDLRSNCYSKCE